MSSKPKPAQMDLFARVPKTANPAKDPQIKFLAPCAKCEERYFSDLEVALRFDVSRATIWRWLATNPDFPNPLKLSPGTSRWKLSDLVLFEARVEIESHAQFAAKTAWKS